MASSDSSKGGEIYCKLFKLIFAVFKFIYFAINSLSLKMFKKPSSGGLGD